MEERFERFFREIQEDAGRDFNQESVERIKQNVRDDVYSRKEVPAERLFDLIIRYANDEISEKTPEFTWLSASALRRKIYKEASKNRGFDYKEGYGDYYSFVVQAVEQGIYHKSLLQKYSKEEIVQAGKLINKELDKKFSYSGLTMLINTYLKKGYNGEILELPQERYVTLALYLMQDEDKKTRMKHVAESYWVNSNHLIGQATPTLMNGGSPKGSLSSCQIITPDDDLISIFKTLEQTARFSQNGSGIGAYLGFLRSSGSWIRGYKGRASGVLHPSRLFSTLAEYVNQLGLRPAGIALYLPVWHADIFDFLDLRLKTGTQEKRAHSINTAVTIPDEFMRRLEKGENWTIFDPYNFRKVMGVDLNRLYDKEKLKDGESPNKNLHAFTYYYRLAEKNDEIEIKRTVKASDIYKSIFIARKTGGTPYMYYHDTSARMNPNEHAGMPFGSNLCSEIIQNMEVDKMVSEEMDKDGFVVAKTLGEGLVTCNLSSLVLNNVFNDDLKEEEQSKFLQRVVDIQYRMLDNVISLNRTPVPQANHTNSLYRAVGGGAMGLVVALTDRGIKWESKEASEFTEKVFKSYLKASIKASHKLSLEKGSYPLHSGSDWNTGAFFDKRGFMSDEWEEYRKMASDGMRNGYLLAVAPTGSNSVIMNSSPSIDPPYSVIYKEDKSGISIMYVPPNYNNKTKWYYKSGFEMDEMWAINVVASAQKYIDQAISHNMHVSRSIKASEMLRLDKAVWNKGVKTSYYTYTENLELPEDCVMCEG